MVFATAARVPLARLAATRARAYLRHCNNEGRDIILSLFRRGFGATEQTKSPTRTGSVPRGERVYAIGDVHGRLDLLIELAKAIQDDDEARPQAATTIVFLGDLIDRGPQSAYVVEFVREWAAIRPVRTIMGNHEEMFLRSFDDLETFSVFLRYGGRETIQSYSGDPARLATADLVEAQEMMIECVPMADREFLATFESRVVMGDYVFVHAGIRPGVPLSMQQTRDMHWIREPFLSHEGPLDYIFVHGHTITREPDRRHSRIGIDTGAFATGRLTALGLEGEDRWFLQAVMAEDGTIAVEKITA